MQAVRNVSINSDVSRQPLASVPAEPVRVVNRQMFDDIECNRCGQCCENFTLNNSPLQLLEYFARKTAHGFEPQDPMLWTGQLEPKQQPDGSYRYSCGYFQRDPDGLGVCSIYDKRPDLCSRFPYGAPNDEFDQCAWNVQLVETNPPGLNVG